MANLNLNILIQLKPPETYCVRAISLSDVPITICNNGFRIISGDIAHWLYIALAGHNYFDHPKASLIYANAARAHIQANAWRWSAWGLAREVVNQWGFHIRPWLGCVLQDEAGRILENAPQYTILFDLITGKEIRPVEQGWIWVGER